jgi:hypothetical protein
MKKIIQGLLLVLIFISAATSFAEEIKVTGIVSKPISGIPKTGQTASYHSGDDGDPLNRWGISVTTRFTPGIGAQVGTVIDNATGLMWEQKTNDGTIHDYDNEYSWKVAFDVFLNGPSGLNTTNFAGYNDWRIPNINELLSIVDYGPPNIHGTPTINLIFRTGSYCTKYDSYWSSTVGLQVFFPGGPPTEAWSLEFLGGMMNYQPQGGWNHVRAVRGGYGGLH